MTAARPSEIDALRWQWVSPTEAYLAEQWNAKLGKFTEPKYGAYTVGLNERAQRVVSEQPCDGEFVFETMRGTHYTPRHRRAARSQGRWQARQPALRAPGLGACPRSDPRGVRRRPATGAAARQDRVARASIRGPRGGPQGPLLRARGLVGGSNPAIVCVIAGSIDCRCKSADLRPAFLHSAACVRQCVARWPELASCRCSRVTPGSQRFAGLSALPCWDHALRCMTQISVGETGFEPAAARPPAGCATRLRHSPRPPMITRGRVRVQRRGPMSRAHSAPVAPFADDSPG